jgi:AcrR family transcriptional regulator
MPDDQLVPPRMRKDAARNRRLILAAAREVFRDRGVAATLNDIAHHAGVGVGTVYRRFANKEDLVDALVDDMADSVAELARAALAQPDAWTGLVMCLEGMCEAQAFDRGLREVMLGTGRGPERQQQMHARIEPAVRELVARAHEQGALRPDVTDADLPILQLMVAAITENSGRPDLWRRYLAVLVEGLRAEPDTTELSVPDVDGPELADLMVRSATRSANERNTGLR